MKQSFALIAKTFKGLEEVLANELIQLGANDVQIQRRSVSFSGDKALMYKVNLHCRTALRVLMPIAEFKAINPDEVYAEIKKINWSDYLDITSSFAIDSIVFSQEFTHSKFVAYRVKDAIVDQFKEKYDKRPSVSVSNPDILINIHIASNNHCTVSLDSSGESLHKRGYRTAQTQAPINEVLASGMLLLAKWKGKSNFIDPMCGSGTFLIEAALIALNIPPGIFRKSFGFEKWKNFDQELFEEIYNDDSQEKEFTFKIYGADISATAVNITEQNIANAGLNKYIEVKRCSINELDIPKDKFLMVTNPPYGERLKDNDLSTLYENIGRLLKFKFAHNEAWIISSEEPLLSKIGLKPSRKIKLLNGDLDCLFCQYEIFDGKRNEYLRKKE
jgi:putative N6-adenine-specific DNA methylase